MSEQAVKTYQEIFEQRSKHPGLTWMLPLREQAWQSFENTGFPSLRTEEWKYTNVRSIAQKQYVHPHIDVVSQVSSAQTDSNWKLQFINGQLQTEGSQLPKAVSLQTLETVSPELQEALSQHWQTSQARFQKHFAQLNMAILQDALVLTIPRDTQLDQAIELHHHYQQSDAAQIFNQRLIVVCEENASATLTEYYCETPAQTNFDNVCVDILMAENSTLEHMKLLHENYQNQHIANIFVTEQAQANYRSHFFALGGKLVRNDVSSILAAPESQIALNGLYLVNGRRHVDMHTSVAHAASNADSEQFYKGILTDKGRAVFNGKIIVDEGTTKTNSAQHNQNLLLSDDAEIDTKPELQIFADDVKASHGASIGDLDEEALFYFQARGIPESIARSMLLFAFCQDVVKKVQHAQVKADVLEHVLQHFDNYESLKKLVMA